LALSSRQQPRMRQLNPEELPTGRVSERMVRISVLVLSNIDDFYFADIEQALGSSQA